jgi:hypothetical protein
MRGGIAKQAGKTNIIALQITLRKKFWKFYLLKYGKNEKLIYFLNTSYSI